jgi:hypothetical protein
MVLESKKEVAKMHIELEFIYIYLNMFRVCFMVLKIKAHREGVIICLEI